MHPRPTILILLPLAPAAASQSLTAELRTLTPYGLFAREASASGFNSWPANKLLPAGPSSIGANTNNAAADTILGLIAGGAVVSCDVSEQGTGNAAAGPVAAGTTASPSSTNVQQGPHELLFQIRGAPGLRGKVEVWATGIAFPGAKVRLAAAVADTNAIDFDVTIQDGNSVFDRRQWDVRLDAAGRYPVRILTDAAVAMTTGNAVYKTGLSVRFTPGAFCDIGGYGPDCGGHLTGHDALSGATRSVTLQLHDAPAQAPALLVAGTQRIAVTLPGTSCLLLADPLALLPFTTDSTGSARQQFSLPAALQFAATIQHVFLASGPRLGSSNGVALAFR